MVSLVKGLREKKGDIKLVALTDDVRSIFQITRLDRIFQIFDTVQEAVESFYK
jgi:anti-anti-sigma factor